MVCCLLMFALSAVAGGRKNGIVRACPIRRSTRRRPARRRRRDAISAASGMRVVSGIAGPGHESRTVDGLGEAEGGQLQTRQRSSRGLRGRHQRSVVDRVRPYRISREVLYELRPFQVVQTPNQVLILYMFEKRWRVIWTDGRPLPKDPDPRWYGYPSAIGKMTRPSS